jgi:hypothetical protein
MKIVETINTANFLGYVESKSDKEQEAYILGELFPGKRIAGLDFSYIKGRNNIAATISPAAFDTEAVFIDREGFDTARGELPLFKNAMKLGEKERQMITTYLEANNKTAVEQLTAKIFDDEYRLLSGAYATLELMRAEALQEGAIAIENNGAKVAVDYGFEAEQTVTLTGTDMWSDAANATILSDIVTEADESEDRTGVRPEIAILNRTTFLKIKANAEIIANMEALTLNPLSDEAVKAYVESVTGIKLVIYSKQVSHQGSTRKLIKDGKFVMLPKAELGQMLAGTSPHEFDKASLTKEADISTTGEGITIAKTATTDPVTLKTLVEFVALPSFEQAHLVKVINTYS